MRSIEDIAILARKVPFLHEPEITFLAEGFGNYNYLVIENGVKYILRIKKSTEVLFVDSLEKEFVFLKYFAAQGITFCPEALYYDYEERFLVEEYLEGVELSQKDFSNEQIDLFARQLHALYQLDVDSFAVFCRENNYQEYEYISPLLSLDVYGFKRFEQAKKLGLRGEESDWIKSHLQSNYESVKSTEGTTQKGFAWGDVQSSVVLKNGSEMYFYDFEHVGISNGAGLSYIKIHGTFNDVQFAYLVERCAFYFGATTEQLYKQMLLEEKIIKVNDVVWAALQWVETKSDSFEVLLRERMALVEALPK